MIDLDSLVKQYPAELRGFRRNMLAEYLQCRILAAVYKYAPAEKLCFIGGTAIRLLYGSLRFSEDIDFDNRGLARSEFEKIGDNVSKALIKEGYICSVDFSFKSAYRCFIRFPGLYFRYGLSGHEDEKLLIQIDAENQHEKYRAESVVINTLGSFIRVSAPPAPVLLSMKIAALLGRKRAKGRDFYDVTYLASRTNPDFNCLEIKTGISGPDELRERLENKVHMLDMKQIAKDVAPFLFSKADEDRVLYFGDFIRSWKIKAGNM